jgi:hypothetical protein
MRHFPSPVKRAEKLKPKVMGTKSKKKVVLQKKVNPPALEKVKAKQPEIFTLNHVKQIGELMHDRFGSAPRTIRNYGYA